MTTEHKESQEPLNIKDVAYESQYRLRRRILEEAAKLGQVNLIMPHGENGYWLDIAVKRGWTNPHLAEVVFCDEITLEELSRKTNPWEIMIFEKRETNEEVAIVQIAKELPSFIRPFYPVAEGLPIYVYNSGRSFRGKKKPLAIIHSDQDLVTVTTQDTEDTNIPKI